jgi:hypothetical protein
VETRCAKAKISDLTWKGLMAGLENAISTTCSGPTGRARFTDRKKSRHSLASAQ